MVKCLTFYHYNQGLKEGNNDKKKNKILDTTPGRAKLSNIIPKHASVDYEIVNKLMTKKEVTNVIDFVYRHCGQKETVIFCDKLIKLAIDWLILLKTKETYFPVHFMVWATMP